MIIGFFIAIILIVFTYIFEVFRYFTAGKIVSTFLGSFVFYLLLYNVTYNSDWDTYEAIYNGSKENSDFLFNLISEFYLARRYDYSFVYKTHILLMGTGFVYFASRFSYSNVFIVISTYLLFQLIPLSNQIRYYVAFAFFLISIYNLIVAKNKFGFAAFAILSLLSHAGTILMYPFLFFYYKTKSEKYFPKLILFSFILAAFFYIIYSVNLVYSNRLSSYFEQEGFSSVAGGIFTNSIWMLWSLFIFLKHKILTKSASNTIKYDIKYQFLYKLSLYSVIFYPISLIVQIFCHRYILSSLIVWVTYILYSMKYESSLFRRLRAISIFLGLVFVTFFHQYLLPGYLFANSGNDLAAELLMSNTIFYFIFL